MKTPKPPILTLSVRDRGETCPRRGIPLVDIYLSGASEGLWMWLGGVSVQFADVIAEWFVAHGVDVKRAEASTDAEHSRNLFSGVAQ